MCVRTKDLKIDHISVCICTFHRPELLSKALLEVTHQLTEPSFTFEVVVVDNDHRRSAESTVLLLHPANAKKVIYDCEPEQNISLARNRAIQSAEGNMIVFMDDDEYPVEDWLIRLYRTMNESKADGVLGPVLPAFPPEAPQWLKKGNIFNRRQFATGTRLTVQDTRTGNVLMSRSILPECSTWFDPAFGRTGGEDTNFFKKQITCGKVFVWCDEAVVYETIMPERWKLTFHMKKYFMIGIVNGENLRKSGFLGFPGFFKSITSMFVWSIASFFYCHSESICGFPRF